MDPCPACHAPILEGQPRATLTCPHVYHTQCLAQNIFHLDMICTVCQVPIVEVEVEEEEVDTHDYPAHELIVGAIRERYQTDQVFRADVAAYTRVYRSVAPSEMAFKRRAMAERNILKPKVEELKELHRQKKQYLLNCDEFKALKEANKMLNRASLRFHRKYTYSWYSLHQALNRRFYRSSPRRILRKCMRIRTYLY
jgi:hypothetical protein